MRPLAIDLFCGLGGWTEGLLAEGFRVVGFDIERHEYARVEKHVGGLPYTRIDRYPAQLVLQNVLTLHGSQFKDAALIVASPPCQEFSFMAMPFSRGKQIAKALRGHGEFPDGYKGSRTIAQLTALFDACFRIQREACEAAGRYIPMVVENVKGAQPWVGRAKAAWGPYYLWGDVPAILPYSNGHRKQAGDPSWFYSNYENSARRFSSRSKERKEWSAQIARIPIELSKWVAQCFMPTSSPVGLMVSPISGSPATPSDDDGLSIGGTLEIAQTLESSGVQCPSTANPSLQSRQSAVPEHGKISATPSGNLSSSTERLCQTGITSVQVAKVHSASSVRQNRSSEAQQSIAGSRAIQTHGWQLRYTISAGLSRRPIGRRSQRPKSESVARLKHARRSQRRAPESRATAEATTPQPNSQKNRCVRRASGSRPANPNGPSLDHSMSTSMPSGKSRTGLSGSTFTSSKIPLGLSRYVAQSYWPAGVERAA